MQSRKLKRILRSPAMDNNAVRVTAADWNGHEFDGCPFSHIPEWLHDALKDEKIKGDNIGCTDYLVWRVPTPTGEKIAEPCDWIVLFNNELYVMDSNDYRLRFFV